MGRLLKQIAKIGSYVFVAAISFVLYNVLHVRFDDEYSIARQISLGIPIAYSDAPSNERIGDSVYTDGDGDDLGSDSSLGGDGGCGGGAAGDSSGSGSDGSDGS